MALWLLASFFLLLELGIRAAPQKIRIFGALVLVGLKPVFPAASEGSMRAVSLGGRIFFVSLFASVMSLVCLDKSPDVRTFGRSHDRATDRTIVLVQLFFHC